MKCYRPWKLGKHLKYCKIADATQIVEKEDFITGEKT